MSGRGKGGFARLHLLLQGRTRGPELPRALLRSFATAVSLASLLQGSGASFAGNLEGRLGLRVVKITLVVAKVDGHPQLTPFLHQPKTFSLKARVNTCKFFAESAHRIDRLLEELMMNDAPPAFQLQRTPHFVLRHGGCGRGVKRRTPSQQGLGAGAAPGTGPASRGALAERGPPLEEELQAEAN